MEDFDFRRLLECIWKKKWIIATIFLITIIIGAVFFKYIQKPIYKVSNKILLQKKSSTAASMVLSDEVLEKALQELKEKGIEIGNINDAMVASYDKTTGILTITGEESVAEDTYQMVDTVTRIYLKYIAENYQMEESEVIEKGEIPQKPYNKNIIKNGVITSIIALAITGLYSIIITAYDSSIKILDSFQKIPAIGKIPEEQKEEIKEQSYEKLRINIDLSTKEQAKIILITSPTKEEQKESIIKNLAKIYAKRKKRVLIIQIEKEEKKNIFNIENLELQEIEQIKEITACCKEIEENISFLYAKYSQRNAISKETTKEFLEKCKRFYDIVLIQVENNDVPEEMLVIANQSDVTIIIATYGKTLREQETILKDQLENAKANVIGMVIEQMPIYHREFSCKKEKQKIKK